MEQAEILRIMKDSGALLEGHFELRSKLHSDRFFQCANVLRYPRRAELLCAELARRLRARFGAAPFVDTVISPAMGGLAVGHELARALDCGAIFAEKVDGKLEMKRFTIRKGERFIVAEDVITRGGRVQETIDIVEKAGGVVLAVAFLVDRSAGTVTYRYPMFSLLQLAPATFEPNACPLCAKGIPMVHPGS